MNSRHRSPRLPALLKIMLLFGLVAAITAIALAKRSIFSSTFVSIAPVSTAKSQAITPVAAQSPRAIANIEAELVTVHPYGFEPAEIKRPMGEFLLVVNDQSGLTGSSLRLNRVTGSTVRAVSARREEPDWSDLVDLEPGVYLLTEINHPLWACRITITPR